MERYEIAGSAFLPTVLLDAHQGIFQISGKSIPENTADFFMPILQWLEQYAQTPNATTFFVFKMEYFNTSTAKYIIEIGRILEKIKDKNYEVKIIWYYEEGDSDIEEAGLDFKRLLQIPVEISPLQADNTPPASNLKNTGTPSPSQFSTHSTVYEQKEQEELKILKEKIQSKTETIQKQQEKITAYKIQQQVAQHIIIGLLAAYFLKEIILEIIQHGTPFTLSWQHRLLISIAFLLPVLLLKKITEARYKNKLNAQYENLRPDKT